MIIHPQCSAALFLIVVRKTFSRLHKRRRSPGRVEGPVLRFSLFNLLVPEIEFNNLSLSPSTALASQSRLVVKIFMEILTRILLPARQFSPSPAFLSTRNSFFEAPRGRVHRKGFTLQQLGRINASSAVSGCWRMNRSL